MNPQPSSLPAGGSSALICRVGQRLVAVGLEVVIATMRPLPVQAFAGAPHYIPGAALIRGTVVPVVDLATLLGVTGSRPNRFVTVAEGDRIAALAVDAVVGVRSLADAEVHDLPPLLGSLDAGDVRAIGTLDESLLLVLGASSLVPDQVWAGLAGARLPGEQPEAPRIESAGDGGLGQERQERPLGSGSRR